MEKEKRQLKESEKMNKETAIKERELRATERASRTNRGAYEIGGSKNKTRKLYPV